MEFRIFSRLPRCLAIVATAMIMCVPTCHGGVLFDNLASLYPPAIGFGAIPVPGYFQYIAQAFTVPTSVDYTLTSFELPISVSPFAGPNQVVLYVMDDSGGLPANVLESFQLSNLPTVNNGTLTTVISLLQPLLLGGSQYWVAATGGTQTTFGGWMMSTTSGVSGGKDIVNGIDQGWTGGPSSSTLGLRVTGDPVPEPQTALLLASAVIAYAGFRRGTRLRSKRAR